MTPTLFIVREQTLVHAPIERCFALSTNLALVGQTLRMRPIAGRTSGNVTGGDKVLWRGWKWGLPHTHQSLIDAFVPPRFFRDRMIMGRFATFEHDHNFTDQDNGAVLLHDELRFSMPWGPFGALVGSKLILSHIRRLMRQRFVLLKKLAEGDEWRQYNA